MRNRDTIIKRIFFFFLSLLFFFYSTFSFVYVLPPHHAFAETPEETVTPTTTDTPPPQPTTTNNTPSVSPTPQDPSPTPSDSPTPSLTPTLTPTPDSNTITATNDATITNTTSAADTTGGNTATSDSGQSTNSTTPTPSSGTPTPTPSPAQVAITTGDATSQVEVDNKVNTTVVNSDFVYQTVNLYSAQNGDINISDPIAIAAQAVTDHPNDPVVNVSVVNAQNFSYITNTVSSVADTGNNTSTSASGGATIATGNAYATVSLLNQVNYVLVNSKVHVLNINIFGSLNGNIVLPNLTTTNSCSNCSAQLTSDNTASVANTVSSTATTGDNTTIGSGNSNITTGNAKSATNVLNVVNSSLLGMTQESLFINVLGSWTGQFIGWDSFGPQASGSLLLQALLPNGSACTTCTSPTLSLTNVASVQNTITSLANTGGNSATGKNSSITTGKADSSIALINFVNSTFVNSLGFFGFINIFGDLHGNIGGKKEFDALNTPAPQDSEQTDQPVETKDVSETNTQDTPEDGGKLTLSQSNNVGAYVFPGDTVTFFVQAKNPGSGKVYNSVLSIEFIKDGTNYGGATFPLGTIASGHGIKLSTGLVLSKSIQPGSYTAHAVITGSTGNGTNNVSASADSTFLVITKNQPQTVTNSNTQDPPPATESKVLGIQSKPSGFIFPAKTKTDEIVYYLLLSFLLYLSIRAVRQQKELAERYTITKKSLLQFFKKYNAFV